MPNKKYFLDLFSGIGGFALGAYWAGLRFDGHYFSEVGPYAVKLYQKRFPDAIALGDVTEINYEELPKGDWLITGGFPCQPHSLARSNQREGSDDKRDLWPECVRAIRSVQPGIALFENVPGLFSSDGGRFFNRVLSDISQIRYDAEWDCLSASEISAPHKRERVWIVAYPSGNRLQNNQFISKDDRKSNIKTRVEWKSFHKTPYRNNKIDNWQEIESILCGDDDGIPADVERFIGLGNAIVPQCAELIFNLSAFNLWRSKNK